MDGEPVVFWNASEAIVNDDNGADPKREIREKVSFTGSS